MIWSSNGGGPIHEDPETIEGSESSALSNAGLEIPISATDQLRRRTRVGYTFSVRGRQYIGRGQLQDDHRQ